MAARQRKDGRFEARVELPRVDGKRRSKSVFGKTRTECMQKLRALKAALARGTLPKAPARLTVAAYLATWLQRKQDTGRRVRTIEGYRWGVGRWQAALGSTRLDALRRADVQHALEVAAKTLSARSVADMHACLRAALNDAIRQELLERNVALLVETPTILPAPHVLLTVEQARALLEAARGERLEAIVTVALSLGLRPSEYYGLMWSAVDLAQRTLYVRTGLERRDGKLQLSRLKTRRSMRPMALPQATVDALANHYERQQAEREVAGAAWDEHGLVFCTRQGRPLHDRNMRYWYKRLFARAGIDASMKVYDLRHSCASLLLAQHIPARVIMELLGHANISITMNTYAGVLPALSQEAADAMDAMLTPEKAQNADVG